MIQYRDDSMTQSLLIIKNPLVVQLRQKRQNVGPNLSLRRRRELRFQLLHNFRQREVAVAEFKDDAPRSLHADRTLRKEHHRSLGSPAPAAPGGKLRDARVRKLSHASSHLSRHPQSEKPPAAAIPAQRKRNKARPVVPKECRTC